jgi:hypothetical protein
VIGLLLAVGQAWGGPAVGAVIEPNDVVAQYRLHAQEKGVSGPAAELLCKAGVEGIQICASVIQENGWRYATMADEDVVRPTETLKLDGMGFTKKEVKNMGSYWSREMDDGREGLVFVQPEVLKGLTSSGLVVAWPVPGVVIAWVPGNPSLDQVLSVGIKQMVEAATHPISAKVYRYVDDTWSVWGEAKKSSSE